MLPTCLQPNLWLRDMRLSLELASWVISFPTDFLRMCGGFGCTQWATSQYFDENSLDVADELSCSAAILHGSVRTLSGIGGIREAKSYVEQTNPHSIVKRLLGEVELVLIWERVHFDGVPSAVIMEEELRIWAERWHDFLNAGTGLPLSQ